MSRVEASHRGLWLAVIVLSGLFVAVTAGMVMRATGTNLSGSLEAGGSSFVAAVGLGLAMRRFLAD